MPLTPTGKVIVFGGSFDPPHVAHVLLPALAMRTLGAQAVVYVPAAQSPHKLDHVGTPAAHRLAMLRLALAEVPHAHILTDELDRAAAAPTADAAAAASPGAAPSYTVDTLEALHRRWGPDPQMRLLIGADQLRVFDTWKSWARIIELAEPLVMVRSPQSRAALLAALPRGFHAGQWAGRIIDLPQIDISSSLIRAQVARGLPITGMVHPAVADYIRRHGLYR
jgi:nicotinate-nucleotide adenylyltransferase